MKEIALVVEDDFDIGVIFAEVLKLSGFDVEVITDGQLAIDRLQEIHPALMILDLHLPSVSGAEILRYIRQTERLKDIRVIVATADPRMGDSVREEANLVLDKPVSFQQLKLLSTRLMEQSNKK